MRIYFSRGVILFSVAAENRLRWHLGDEVLRFVASMEFRVFSIFGTMLSQTHTHIHNQPTMTHQSISRP